MKLREALKAIIDEDNTEYVCQPFSLYSKLADFVGADYCERDKLELLFKIDQRLSLVKRLSNSGAAEVPRIKGEFLSVHGLCRQREFDEILDAAASVLVEGYVSPEPDEPDDFDYGSGNRPAIKEKEKPEAKTGKKVEDFLTDENGLRQFTVAQLRGYCRTHGVKGYSSLTKSQLIAFILYLNKKRTPGKRVPVHAKNFAHKRHHTISARSIRVMLPVAAVIGGIVCLAVFAKQIQWYQWQHMIGAIGGLLVCGVGFLFSLGMGLFMNFIITNFDGYLMMPLIVDALLAIVNFVLAFVFGEAYIIIFYWLCGYFLLASLIGMGFCFLDYETGAGVFGIINAVVIAGMITTQVLIQIL